jgi:hypothetical protein
MRSYYVEVFADERPVHKATYQCSNEATAMARAMRDARKNGQVKRSHTLFVARVRKLKTPGIPMASTRDLDKLMAS